MPPFGVILRLAIDERTELAHKTRRDDLEDPFGAVDASEPVGAQLDEMDACAQIGVGKPSGGVRHEDLTAAGCGEEPRTTIERPAQPVVGDGLGLARVHRHPHFDRLAAPVLGRKSAGAGDRGLDRSRGCREDRVERVADSLEDLAATRLDRNAQQLLVEGERHAHVDGVVLPALGAADDVGEEKRRRSPLRTDSGVGVFMASSSRPVIRLAPWGKEEGEGGSASGECTSPGVHAERGRAGPVVTRGDRPASTSRILALATADSLRSAFQDAPNPHASPQSSLEAPDVRQRITRVVSLTSDVETSC